MGAGTMWKFTLALLSAVLLLHSADAGEDIPSGVLDPVRTALFLMRSRSACLLRRHGASTQAIAKSAMVTPGTMFE